MYFIFIVAAYGSAKLNCHNGNHCNEKETCLGAVSQNVSLSAGRKFGCSPWHNATACQDYRFSCPAESKCETSTKSICTSHSQGSFEATRNLDSHRYLKGNSSGICEIVDGDLPSECVCMDSTFGASLNCTVDIFNIDDIGMYADFLPCGKPAHMGVMVYDTKFGITYEVGEIAAGDSIYEPIPGLSITIPGLATGCGVYAVVSLGGNLEELDAQLGLDVCCMIDNEKLCGSKLSSFLPVMFLSGNFTFSSLCHSGNQDLAGETTLYKISSGECGQATLDSKYASYAEKFAGLIEGTCTAQGYTVADGTQTLKVPVIGDITIAKFKKATVTTELQGEKCCTDCVAPEVKYFSVDVPHGFCGETCINPKEYFIFKVFEKNLTKATDNTPCREQFTPNGGHYTNYTSTVTHGVPGLKVTLDLYGPV